VVNVGGAFNKDAIKQALKTMPTRYLRNRSAMTHFVSIDNETEIRDTYANRVGALGDANLQGQNKIYTFGSEIEPVALMPGANGLFTDPNNLIFGIQRNLMMEYDKDITTRMFIVVLTARLTFAIEETNAIVKYTGITGSR
jgi:predicted Rdx family selenoprotein